MLLFVSDFDGTLHINDTVDQETLDAIKLFREKGHLFGIATGRSLESIKNQVRIYDIPVDFLIGNNGSVAVDEHDSFLFHHFMDFTKVHEIIDLLPKEEVLYYGISDGINVGLHDRLNNRSHPDISFVDMDKFLVNERAVGIFVKFQEDEQAKKFALFLNEKYYDEIRAYHFYNYVDILNYGVTKKNGIIQYKRIKNLHAKTYVIGDSFNDIPMIKGFDGFAICSGEEEVIQRARMCFDNVGKALYHVMEESEI